MPRTPMVTRDRVPEPLRAAFDAETASSGGVVATGPGSVMINSPEMRRRANHLADYLRNASTLPKKIQELAMLTTARAMDCQFIWHAHAARGRHEGLSDALVEALRDNRPLPPMPADEAAVVHYGVEDGCADRDAEVHTVLMQRLFPRQATVVSAEAVIQALSST